ncbi:MAG: hypothetical protein Alpg2KO_00280 [Alphaproteobacteria bacterium]
MINRFTSLLVLSMVLGSVGFSAGTARADNHGDTDASSVAMDEIMCSDVVVLDEDRGEAIAYLMGYIAGQQGKTDADTDELEGVYEAFLAECVTNPGSSAMTVMRSSFGGSKE